MHCWSCLLRRLCQQIILIGSNKPTTRPGLTQPETPLEGKPLSLSGREMDEMYLRLQSAGWAGGRGSWAAGLLQSCTRPGDGAWKGVNNKIFPSKLRLSDNKQQKLEFYEVATLNFYLRLTRFNSLVATTPTELTNKTEYLEWERTKNIWRPLNTQIDEERPPGWRMYQVAWGRQNENRKLDFSHSLIPYFPIGLNVILPNEK